MAGVATLASLVCTAAGTFGGGYGATGATISTAGVGQFNGALTTDGALTAASATFGDGNITNVGNIALDSISSDAGTSVAITLGTDAGDDLLVGTDKLVVEGDTGRVGIGTTAPAGLLEIVGTNVYSYFDASQHVSLFMDRGSTSYDS